MSGWLHYPAEQLRKAPSGADMSRAQDMTNQAVTLAGPTPSNEPRRWPNRPANARPENAWGYAGQPLAPTTPAEQPYIFDYPHGINLIAQPRAGFGLHSFLQLRLLADACEEIRLPIELLKREVRALEWDVEPLDDAEPSPKRLKAARDRLRQPDGPSAFDGWVNMLLEELLVTDAVTLYPNRRRGGLSGDLELLDGATIRPLLDRRGRTPAPPLPAYTQVVKGTPVGQWTRDDLWYLPYNRVIRHPYGRPAVELVIITVNMAIRRATGQLGLYTEGNIPEALVGLPADWTANQISDFQDYWDALLSADEQRLQKIKFFPVGGTGQPPVYEFQRSDGDNVPLNEWLLRVGCWAVGVTPAEFGLVPGEGLGGAGFAEGQANVQYRMGLGPITQHLKGLFDRALQAWGFDDIEFRWTSTQRPAEAMQQAQIDEIRLRTGVYDLPYVQEREGIPPENRPESAPSASPSPFPSLGPPFQMTAGGDFHKAERGDDPHGDDKMGLAETLQEALLEYFAGLRERVADVAQELSHVTG